MNKLGSVTWIAWCIVAALWSLVDACTEALVGEYGFAAFHTVATVAWLLWTRSAVHRWRTRAVVAQDRGSAQERLP